MHTIKTLIDSNTKQICYLHRQIHSTFKNRHTSASHWALWEKACDVFHCYYDQLVFTLEDGSRVGEDGLFEELKKHNPYAIEYAICFIELRPYFFRSGYIYQKLLRRLAYAKMTQSQKDRYNQVKQGFLLYRKQKFMASQTK